MDGGLLVQSTRLDRRAKGALDAIHRHGASCLCGDASDW